MFSKALFRQLIKYDKYILLFIYTVINWIYKNSKLQKGYPRLAAASDKVYQLLAHDRWFSPGTPASSTTKAGHHDIAEILLKVALKHHGDRLV
jgi:hypothetical protein